ncbi:hypothetical protein CBL_08525 [Carabus blaptoides fortunei]
MDPFCLARDELEYELSIRSHANLESVSAMEMRNTLTKLLKSEPFATVVNPGSDLLDMTSELTICMRKTTELQDLASEISGNTQANEGKKFFSKLSHILGRLSRITAETDDISESVKKLRTELYNLESKVFDKYQPIARDVKQVTQKSVGAGKVKEPNILVPVTSGSRTRLA